MGSVRVENILPSSPPLPPPRATHKERRSLKRVVQHRDIAFHSPCSLVGLPRVHPGPERLWGEGYDSEL